MHALRLGQFRSIPIATATPIDFVFHPTANIDGTLYRRPALYLHHEYTFSSDYGMNHSVVHAILK
jgi:hypothetical protein